MSTKKMYDPQILLINGPPRSGKDTAAKLIKKHFPHPVTILKFADELKRRTHGAFGLNDDVMGAGTFETSKDEPSEYFLGLTPRQAYIELSENFYKRLYGKRIFGELLAAEIEKYRGNLIVVPDSGFMEEAQVLLEQFANIALVRLHRQGCTFEGDSRGYIALEGIPNWDVVNPDGDMNGLLENLKIALPELGMPQFVVEAQLPTAAGALDWFQQGKPRPSLEQALAAVEHCRQHGYRMRIFRIRQGDQILKLVMPEDEPVTYIEKSRAG